jgi:hypothetical protein
VSRLLVRRLIYSSSLLCQLTEQTVNIQAIYDLFTGHVSKDLSPITLITRFSSLEGAFSASVVRLQIKGYPIQTKGPATIVEAIECESAIEALQRLYQCSQPLLNRSCELSAQCRDGHTGFSDWDDLAESHDNDGWDSHCGMVSVASGSVM